jgi:hypothetical protein
MILISKLILSPTGDLVVATATQADNPNNFTRILQGTAQ